MNDYPSRDPSLDSDPRDVMINHYRLIAVRQWSLLKSYFQLTDRELQIAQLVCQGLETDPIAGLLAISAGTVKTHLRNIYRKTGVHNKVSLLLLFLREIYHQEKA